MWALYLTLLADASFELCSGMPKDSLDGMFCQEYIEECVLDGERLSWCATDFEVRIRSSKNDIVEDTL